MTDAEHARLQAAETVCHLYGWCPAPIGPDATNNERATFQAWMHWTALIDDDQHAAAIEAWPDTRIQALADLRQTTQMETIERIHDLLQPDEGPT